MKKFFSCRGLRKSYGEHVVLPGIDLVIEQGSIAALIGASGCGKSTFLHVAAGFITSDGGDMLLDGLPCAGPGPDRVMVFQDDALFPWLNVRENVEFGLKTAGMPHAQRQKHVREMLRLVGLEPWDAALPSCLLYTSPSPRD